MVEPGQRSDSDLEQLVIDQYPAALVTLEVSRQLARLLPIASVEELRRKLEESPLEVSGETLPLGRGVNALPAEVFPIETVADLVAKVAAAVRIGTSAVADGHVRLRSDRLTRLAVEAAASAGGGRGGIPAVHFAGPSLFGHTRRD